METNFQTSFIPKKPAVTQVPKKSRPVGLLMIISIVIFFTVLIVTAVLYFYKQGLTNSIAKMENNLTLAKNRFEPEKITQLELLNRRLESAGVVLGNHVAPSPVFDALERITMKTVRYTKFSYSSDNGKIKVNLSGMAVDYRSVALQSDLYSKYKFFIDPVFSNLSLDQKGNVSFDLEFSVDPALVDYQKVLEGTNIPDGYLPDTILN